MKVAKTGQQRLLAFMQELDSLSGGYLDDAPHEQSAFWELHQWFMALKDELMEPSDPELVTELSKTIDLGRARTPARNRKPL